MHWSVPYIYTRVRSAVPQNKRTFSYILLPIRFFRVCTSQAFQVILTSWWSSLSMVHMRLKSGYKNIRLQIICNFDIHSTFRYHVLSLYDPVPPFPLIIYQCLNTLLMFIIITFFFLTRLQWYAAVIVLFLFSCFTNLNKGKKLIKYHLYITNNFI